MVISWHDTRFKIRNSSLYHVPDISVTIVNGYGIVFILALTRIHEKALAKTPSIYNYLKNLLFGFIVVDLR